MYPHPTRREQFLGRKPQVYGSIEHTFYAYKIKFRPDILNVIIPSIPDRASDNDLFTYFGLITRVGVGAKGQRNIKIVHIRFRLMPLDRKLPEAEVVQIYPITKSNLIGKTVGIIEENMEKGFGGKGGADGGVSTPPIAASASVSGHYDYEKKKHEKTEYELKEELIISNASGVASRAIWEFYQGRGIASIGQFNLEIIFRMPQYKKEYANNYCIDWNVEVNGRKLLDHEDELQNEYWNVDVDDRKLMTHETNIEKTTRSTLGIDDNPERKKKALELLNAEDPQRKRRLLRPLLIIDNYT